jgi:two-component system chemotaxis sensor kinase CheA
MKDKHTEAFVQEAFELLEVLESSLLELETKPDDEELIGKVFRALHTIKGSGGMFGFDDVAVFVHDIETVFDRIRNGELSITNRIIDLTLKSCDRLNYMIKNNTDHSTIKDEEALQLVDAFKEFLGSEKKESKSVKKLHEENNVSSGKKVFNISFKPSEDLLLHGSNPINIINEIAELGNTIIIPDLQSVPDLDSINPELIYTSWNIILSTEKDINAIKDVFIFVEDDCQIKITEIDSGELKGDAAYYRQLINPAKDKKDKTQKAKSEKTTKSTPSQTSGKEGSSSIRVNIEKLDHLVNLVGELVTAQARLSQEANKINTSGLNSVSEDFERLIWELRENALSIRMLPIGSTFGKFNRLVRDLSNELGKEVELVTDGGETELDKNVLEKLNDPLVHIIRNCIDHGIEKPESRVQKNKPRTGKILLSALHSGTHVLITIKDDGAGLNKENIFKKALENGIVAEGSTLTEKDIYNLIFKAGFSTAKEITNVSGRGVGLDVVKTAIESLRGSVDVESKPGDGTTITLKLPLTLAIIEGLVVRIDTDHFVIPLSNIEECIELTKEAKSKANERNLVQVRGEIIPFIPLRRKFQIINNQPLIEQIVVINKNGLKTGLVVDEIIGERQTVIKTLGSYYKHIEEISGATVMGDGTVALILDVNKLVNNQILEEQNYN